MIYTFNAVAQAKLPSEDNEYIGDRNPELTVCILKLVTEK